MFGQGRIPYTNFRGKEFDLGNELEYVGGNILNQNKIHDKKTLSLSDLPKGLEQKVQDGKLRHRDNADDRVARRNGRPEGALAAHAR